MHVVNGLDAFFLEPFDNFLGVGVIFLEYGIFGSILSKKLRDLVSTELKQAVEFGLQIQVIEVASSVVFGSGIHGNVEMHGVDDRHIQKFALTHQHVA